MAVPGIKVSIPHYIRVHSDGLEQYWPVAEPFVYKAYESSESLALFALAYEELQQDLAHMWLFTENFKLRAVVLARIMEYPPTKVYEMFSVAGEGDDHWQARLRVVENYARSQGCSEIFINGRPGWARVFKSMGYKVNSVQVGKELTSG